MTEALSRSELAGLFTQAAEELRDALGSYIDLERPNLRFQRTVVLAVATLESLPGRSVDDDSDLRLLRGCVSDAAAVCRTQRPHDALVAAAALLDEVERACDAALAGARGEQRQPWLRFLFADADVSVVREHGFWRVRVGSKLAQSKLLDEALGELLKLSNHRIGSLTVQILSWYEH